MATADYCDYKLSLALKAAGFDEPCDHYYTPNKAIRIVKDNALAPEITNNRFLDEIADGCCTAVSLWQAQKWLREKWGIYAYCEPNCLKKWFEENYVEGYALDKDLLSRGAKVYSAETCCYIPPEINSALVHSSSNMGVHENHNKFETIVNRYGKRCFMGSFNTRAEAVNAYIKGKIAYIKELGEVYYAKGLITKRVYDGLQNYSVPYPA